MESTDFQQTARTSMEKKKILTKLKTKIFRQLPECSGCNFSSAVPSVNISTWTFHVPLEGGGEGGGVSSGFQTWVKLLWRGELSEGGFNILKTHWWAPNCKSLLCFWLFLSSGDYCVTTASLWSQNLQCSKRKLKLKKAFTLRHTF